MDDLVASMMISRVAFCQMEKDGGTEQIRENHPPRIFTYMFAITKRACAVVGYEPGRRRIGRVKGSRNKLQLPAHPACVIISAYTAQQAET